MINKTKEEINMEKLKIDVVVHEGETITEAAAKITTDYDLAGFKIITEQGPGGGWPVIEFEGES